MRHAFYPLLAAICGAMLVGCIKTKQLVTLNPDGSGKLEYHVVMPMTQQFGPGGQMDPEAHARQFARRLIEQSKGVDAWESLEYNVDDQGQFTLDAVAYFPDLNAVEIGGGQGVQIGGPRPHLKREEGSFRLVMKQQDATGGIVVRQLNPDADLDEKALDQRVAMLRQQHQQGRAAMQGMIQDFQAQWVVILPGPVAEASVFEKDGRRVTLTYDGPKFLAAMDALVEDDQWMRQQARERGNLHNPDLRDLHEKMFGQHSMGEAVVEQVGQPQFDYKQAVAQAAEAELQLRQELGLAARPVALGPDQDVLKDVRVVGVQWVREADPQQNLHVFHAHRSGYTLGLLMEFNAAALRLDDIEFTTAVDDTGASLLPDRQHFHPSPRLSEEKTQAVLEMHLKQPAPRARGLMKVAGQFVFVGSGGMETVDAGALKTQPGERAENLPIRVREQQGWNNDRGHMLNLIFEGMAREDIDSVRFYDAEDNPIAADERGGGSMNDDAMIFFQRDEPWPETVRVVVRKHKDLKRYKIPFELSNLDLLGKPLGVQ